MDLSFYSRILTLQEGHHKLHSNLREANSPCILTGCRVCPVLLSFFPSSLLCLESTRTVNLRGKTGSLIALVSGGFHGLPSGFFFFETFLPEKRVSPPSFLSGACFPTFSFVSWPPFHPPYSGRFFFLKLVLAS